MLLSSHSVQSLLAPSLCRHNANSIVILITFLAASSLPPSPPAAGLSTLCVTCRPRRLEKTIAGLSCLDDALPTTGLRTGAAVAMAFVSFLLISFYTFLYAYDSLAVTLKEVMTVDSGVDLRLPKFVSRWPEFHATDECEWISSRIKRCFWLVSTMSSSKMLYGRWRYSFSIIPFPTYIFFTCLVYLSINMAK